MKTQCSEQRLQLDSPPRGRPADLLIARSGDSFTRGDVSAGLAAMECCALSGGDRLLAAASASFIATGASATGASEMLRDGMRTLLEREAFRNGRHLERSIARSLSKHAGSTQQAKGAK